MNRLIFKTEKNLIKSGFDFVIGIDEVGRGPLAGPIVACAAAFKLCHSERKEYARGDKSFKLIRDSKMLSEKQRESLYAFICDNFYFGIGICDHKTIDRVNILQATFLAMKKAIADLKNKLKECHSRVGGNLVNKYRKKDWIPAFAGMTDSKYIILVDGNKPIPNISIEQKAIVNGDRSVKTISAASIIAKVTRDRIMRRMHETYPCYCFEKHKGYGTKLHFEMLKKHGPCEIHRKSFNLGG